jgi:hypothetical protein
VDPIGLHPPNYQLKKLKYRYKQEYLLFARGMIAFHATITVYSGWKLKAGIRLKLRN